MKKTYVYTYVYSVEKLVHFQCTKCAKWWSVGDAPDRGFWYCPWCGVKLLKGKSNV